MSRHETFEGFKIHNKNECIAPCPFHSPSDHPLNKAKIHIRGDKNFLVERICKHGVGHDDPDSVAYMKANGQEWAGTHGCDGCCTNITLTPSKEEQKKWQDAVDLFQGLGFSVKLIDEELWLPEKDFVKVATRIQDLITKHEVEAEIKTLEFVKKMATANGASVATLKLIKTMISELQKGIEQ